MTVRRGDWIVLPADVGDPLAQVQITVAGRSYPAFIESGNALVRCPDLPTGSHRVSVSAGGRTVHSSTIQVA